MKSPTLENQRVRLSPLYLGNYKQLCQIANQKKLVQYSPSKIDTPKDLKNYVEIAIDNYYHENALAFIIFDKE